MLTLRRVFILILLALAFGLSSWSIYVSSNHTTTLLPKETEPDAYLEEVTSTILNKQGKPSLKIVTKKMTHYPEGDTTQILKPQVTLYRDSKEPWKIHSDFAKATHGSKEILFWSHVNINHHADEEHPETSMQTDYLNILPEQQLAITDQPVTFIQPETTIQAVGMRANLNAGTIQLLSKAKGIYAPTS